MQKLGPYRIIRPLAIGGQAEVLLAELAGPGGFAIRHALKVLKEPLSGQRPVDVPEARSLIAEARLLARLSHPHTLAIHGLHVFNDRLVEVLGYVPGRSLSFLLQRLRRQKEALPLEHALWVARCVLMALDRAHALRDDNGRPLQVVHRDVNPQNILLGYDGQLKLIDFGIAISRIATRDTRFGVVKGKLAYMSPEQAYGLDDLDHRSDIYALGLVLYEMATGKMALAGDENTALERARHPVIAPARHHNSRLPSALDAILARALARKPERRFTSAREMMMACSELLHTVNPRYCGDELGPFVRAILTEEHTQEKRATAGHGTQVVHEDELGQPPKDDFNPSTLRFSQELADPLPSPDDADTADVAQPPNIPAATPPKLPTPPPIAALSRPDKTHKDAPPGADDALDLDNLLQAIEDIYKRRSGEDPNAPPDNENTQIYRKNS